MTYQAGYKSLRVPNLAMSLAFPLSLFYPTESAATPTNVGSYPLNVAVEVPLASGAPHTQHQQRPLPAFFYAAFDRLNPLTKTFTQTFTQTQDL